jgi:hypothetical protein
MSVENDLKEIKKKLEELEQRILQIENNSLQPQPISKKTSLQEFITQKNAKNDVQKTLAIGYYIGQYSGPFNSKDIEKGFIEARERIPINVSDKIKMNCTNGDMIPTGEEKEGLKAYVLSNGGIKKVEKNFKDE